MKQFSYRSVIKVLLLGLTALSMSSVSAEELFRPGDRIVITVFGHPDLATEARVSDSGIVTMPLIRQVLVAGLTAGQVERAVGRALSQEDFVRNPKVSVALLESVGSDSEAVTILGHVNRPGRFVVSDTETGVKTLVNLLALAGGLSPDAGQSLTLTRLDNGTEVSKSVDLINLIQRGSLSQNHSLRGGDVVFVPRMQEFYIYGEVRKPGRYRLENNMSVIQALAVSGGLTASGTEKGMSVRRTNAAGESKTYKANLDLSLQPNDVLYVRESLF